MRSGGCDERHRGRRYYAGRDDRIAAASPESGEGFDEIPIEYAGPNMTIGFNAKYFLDVLGALDEDEIQLGLGGELDPAVVRPVGPRQFLAVVMPMRI